MALETVTYIADLVETNPTSTDPKNQGDDQMRNIKKALKQCLNGFPGAILVTATDTGAASAHVLTPPTALAAYTAGLMLLYLPANANVGAVTVNVSALGAKSIKTISGADPSSGDILANQPILLMYNGTNFVIIAGSEYLSRTGAQTVNGDWTFAGAVSLAAATGVTKAVGDNSTSLATTAFVAATAFASALPAQTGNNGGVITTNGTSASWVTGVGQSGKILTTNGTTASWTDTLTGQLNNAATVTIASAATVNIGAAASNDLIINGTTTITAFDSIAAGATRKVKFSGALTLTHNATSLILPGGANITTAANDEAQFTSLGSGNWICDWYTKADGTPVKGGYYSQVATYTVSGTPASISFTGLTSEDLLVCFSGVQIAASAAALNIAVSTDNGANYGAQISATAAAALQSSSPVNGTPISITGLKSGNLSINGGTTTTTAIGTSGGSTVAGVNTNFAVGAPVNAIRLTASSGENFTAGTVVLKGRG